MNARFSDENFGAVVIHSVGEWVEKQRVLGSGGHLCISVEVPLSKVLTHQCSHKAPATSW